MITDAAQRSIDSFSTTETMASLAVNSKFKQGYEDLQLGHLTDKAYIWKALSAVSEELGQSLFSNVRHYIDNVSNIDTCKVKALKSMMKMASVNYMMLDKLSFYPVEI